MNYLGFLGLIFGFFVLVVTYEYNEDFGIYLAILTLVILLINRTDRIKDLTKSNK